MKISNNIQLYRAQQGSLWSDRFGDAGEFMGRSLLERSINFGQEAIILRDGDILTVPDLLPGWEVPIADLWPPEFD